MIKPWLLLPPEVAYKVAPLALKAHKYLTKPKHCRWKPFEWKGMSFLNPLGTSGGVDKNAEHIEDWWRFGVGFQELGTVTPLPQSPNPGKIIDRSNKDMAIWNKMGFPNLGLEVFKTNISRIQRPYYTPLFLNIGKNRGTPNDKAYEDYILCLRSLHPFADAFVINISSPNTSGLRDLLQKDHLRQFLEPIVAANLEMAGGNRPTPLLLKLSPDQNIDELGITIETSLDLGLDGWILTNTTTQLRDQLSFPDTGGISGAPLAPTSKNLLKQTVEILGSNKQGKLLVSSGGVMTPDEAFERLELGADLVQVYAALIFEGPQFFAHVAKSAVKSYS